MDYLIPIAQTLIAAAILGIGKASFSSLQTLRKDVSEIKVCLAQLSEWKAAYQAREDERFRILWDKVNATARPSDRPHL